MGTVTNGVTASAAQKRTGGGAWTFRSVILKLHLYLALVSAVFFLILGVTGTVIAFEQEIPRWLHPSLWYVRPTSGTQPESQLVLNVEKRFAPARVGTITIERSPRLAQVMQIAPPGKTSNFLTGQRVFVNPYDGTVLGTVTGRTRDERLVQTLHDIHLRIGLSATGKWIISVAGLILCFEIIFGLILWWRWKRFSVHWKGSWFRIFFDAHNAIGILAALFLLLAAFTGIVIGFDFTEPLIYRVTHSSRPPFERPPASEGVPGAAPINVDQAIAVARRAIPAAALAMIQMPANPRGSFQIWMRLPIPSETSPAVHTIVSVDQYTGRMLRVQDMRSYPGYRVIRLNRALHTGDILGFAGHTLTSLTSLVLVVMVLTGVVIWWKKLAI